MENRFDRQANESQYFHLAQTLKVVGSTLKGLTFEVNKGFPQIKVAFDRADGSFEPGMRLFFRNELTDDDLAFLKDANITDADLAWGAFTENKQITDPKTGEVKMQKVVTVAAKPSVIALTVNGKAWMPSGDRREYNA